jgi:SAM-dependent methyltransferase
MAGWHVHSAEMWARYAPALDLQKRLLADTAIDVIDTSMIVGRPQGPRYDAVLFMAVIEHLSSARHILKTLYHALIPGGYLIMDCPNLAYLPNRRKLNRGQSPYAAIADQFRSVEPFEGHVREYTAQEVHWMLRETGFTVCETEFSNYSPAPWWKVPVLDQIRMLFPPYLESPILDHVRMTINPELRELIFVVGRKPNPYE